jgi:hypothetical protein
LPDPTAAGVYDTEQLAESRAGAGRLHLGPLKAPAPELTKLTVPVGATPVGSVTVAVQVVDTFANTEVGAQLTVVDTARTTFRTVATEPPSSKAPSIS